MNGAARGHKPLKPTNTRVLLIDDARVSKHVIRQKLVDLGYQYIQTASHAHDIKDKLRRARAHIVLLDWMAPEFNGLAMTKMIRAQDLIDNTKTYVLMITGKDTQEAMHEAFSAGVDDFIAKADVENQLSPRLLRANITLNQWRDHRRKNLALKEELEEQARLITRDPATKLPSSRGFADFFANSLSTSVTRGQDLQCLQVVMTNYAALVGALPEAELQRMMRSFADKLTRLIRPTDYLARTSTDEFMILIQSDESQMLPALARIEKALDSISLRTQSGYHLLQIRTAGLVLKAHEVSEDLDAKVLRAQLREQSQQALPLSHRLSLHETEPSDV